MDVNSVNILSFQTADDGTLVYLIDFLLTDSYALHVLQLQSFRTHLHILYTCVSHLEFLEVKF